MLYSWNDTNYYLENYDQIRLELNLHLISNFREDSEKLNVSISKSGKETEQNYIRKLDNEKYKKDMHALKCVDILYKEMDSRERDIMCNKYILRISNFENSIKTYCSESTIKRNINHQRKKLLKKLNKS